jgi:TfoX/Sxy family transcriptional regulator of competence genes
MAYDEDLAERVRALVGSMGETNEISMFGGLCFTLNGNMFVGVMKDDLMVRVGPESHDAALKLPGARPMDFAKRPMKGYVYVDRKGTADGPSLAKWVTMGSDFASTLPPKKPKPGAKKKRS